MPKTTEPERPAGLFLMGEIVARKRREVRQADGRLRYCITLYVRCGPRTYTADRWADVPRPEDTPQTGQNVSLQVEPHAYLSHGVAMARLSWGEDGHAGSDF
jgi:hypothetical protein